MKKLTAGIFATLLAVVSADGAYAAIASQGYVDDKVEAVETTVAAKADSSTVTALAGRVTTAEGEIDTLQSTVAEKADKATTLSGYGITDAYTSAKGTALEGRVSAVEAPKAQVAANVTGPVSGGTVFTAIQNVSGNVGTVTSDVEALQEDMTQAQTDISDLQEASATHATKTELTDGLKTKQDKLTQTGSASQPVYVNAEGKVTVGNTIPTVTTNITTGQTGAAQAGAVADALADKADSTDIPTTVAELTDADNYALVSTMNTELAKKQNSLTETQLNAVNSGITTTKVATYDGYAAKITANTEAIGTKADADDVTTLTGRVAAVEAPKATVAEGVTGPVSGGTVYTAIQGVTGDVSGVTGRVDTLEGEMDTAQADISGLKTDLADKQDKLTQTGSASQPVYVDATGKVTAGNTIPTVTTTIAAGQTGAAQAGAVATALAAKANSTDVYTKSAADDAFIPRPSANCTATGTKCVLVTNGTGFEWEVIVRGDEE